MKKKIISVICIFIIILTFFTACKKGSDAKEITKGIAELLSATKKDSDAGENTINHPEELSVKNLGKGETTFVFAVVDDKGEQEVFNISTNQKIVGDALKELDLISGEEGKFGLYVKTVNGKSFDYNKDGKYWAFYINGEYASTGVDKTEICETDIYMFKVE